MATKNNRERGQALLEGALTTMMFVTLLIGVIDVGQVLFVHQSIVERVRSAVRYGAVRPFDADAVENMVLYRQAAAPGSEDPDTEVAPPGFLGITPDMVTVARQDATFNEDRLVVTVQGYPFTFFTPFIAGIYQGRPITASMSYEVTE